MEGEMIRTLTYFPVVAFLIAAGLLVGCAETGRSGFDVRMGALVGLSEEALRGRMGAPDYDHTHEGRRSLGYSETWTETVFQPGGGPGGMFQELTRRCEVIFAVDEGRVAGFRTRGGACGWAGRQNFSQA